MHPRPSATCVLVAVLAVACGGNDQANTGIDTGVTSADSASDSASDGATYDGGDVAAPTVCTPDAGWTIETTKARPAWSSAKLGADRTVHVFYRATAAGFEYSRRTPAGAWTFEPVDSVDVDVSAHGTLELDRDGGVHVAYRGSTSMPVRYAKRASDGTWSKEVVDPAGVDDFWPTMIVGDDGRVHLAYTRKGARYAVRATDGTWSLELVEPTGIGVAPIALVGSTVHLAYTSGTQLRHAQRATDGKWTFEDPVSEGAPNQPVAWTLLIDGSGGLRMLYGVREGFKGVHLGYAEGPSGGSFSTTTIESVPSALLFPFGSLAFDTKGTAHAAYSIEIAKKAAIRLASRPAGSSWTRTTVDCDGAQPSIGLDAEGGIHLVYARATTLVYAHR